MKTTLLFLLSVIIFPLCLCAGEVPSFANGNPSSMNIICYNIRMNTTSDGVNAWPLRKEKVTGLLKFHKADIFGVQEALPKQVADLVDAFPEFNYYGVGRDDGISEGEHMSIFYRKSRYEKLNGGTFWLNEAINKPDFGWDAVCNRTCTWLKLKDLNTGKLFYIFNTHFDHRGVTAREESAKLIIRFMKEINRDNLPFILTGDFNAVKESAPIRIILEALKDSRDISESTPYGPDGTSGGFEVKEKTRTIDYIFVNEKVRILRHGNLSESYGLFYPSDHLPVLAEIELK